MFDKTTYHREYQRKRRLTDPAFVQRGRDAVNKYHREKRKLLKDVFVGIKERAVCQTCGEIDTACLVFHHRDPKQKKFGINCGGISDVTTVKRLMDEIAKCDILCSNCHMKLHFSKHR